MAEWDAAYQNDLPDSAFACIDAGGERDEDGKTVPRSLRHYPHHNAASDLDMPHLRNALSRVAQEDTTSCGVGHLRDHAKEQDVGKGSSPQYKQFTPHELKLDDAGTIELAFAQLNVIDGDGDVTLPGAFPTKDVPMSAYGHTSWDGALPVGRGSISEANGWGVFKGQFFMDTTAGRDTHATLKGLGPLAEYSYGYNVLDGGPGTHEGKSVRFLKALDVIEVSPVLKGAGVGTHTMAIKSAPEPGASMADLVSWYSEAKIMERFKGHVIARASEGRKLSRADRALFEDYVELIGGDLSEGVALLSADDPPVKMVDPITLEVLLGLARANGVAV